MQKILFKRSLRNFKSNIFSYIALFLLILVCMVMVVANNTAADTIITRSEEFAKANCVEDGQITAILPLSDSELEILKNKGITIEENFYEDYPYENDSTIRIYKNRKEVNKQAVSKGRLSEAKDEITIEIHYADAHNIKVDDVISVGGKDLKVVGIVSSPDYETVVMNTSTSFTNAKAFGTAFLTDEGYEDLSALGNYKNSESYIYSYLLNDKMGHEELKNLFKTFRIKQIDIDNSNIQISQSEKAFLLTQSKFALLEKAEDNLRIHAAADDQVPNKQTGILAGLLILILFSYVISVFISHEITEDSAVIGTLYSLGVKRKDLVLHYLYTPLLITFLGGLLGYLIGMIGPVASAQINNVTSYYSLPDLPIVHSAYLIVYSIVLPPLISLLVNFIVIYRKLNRPALSLIRKEGKVKKYDSKIKLDKLNFTHKFQARQFARESKASVAVVVGLLICTIVLMLSLNCQVMCNNLQKGAEEDVKFNYAYTYKFPTEEPPANSHEAYGESFKREIYGFNMDITLLGITKDNPYFDVKTSNKNDEVIISDSLSQKFNVKVGDTITFKKTKEYTFKVIGITEFSPSFYMFMDIDLMRDLFNKDDSYFNIVFSDEKLDIPSENLYAVTPKSEAIEAATVVVDIMNSMIWSLMILSIVIFTVVMYMMLKMMIDKSTQNISLLMVMGYTPKEVRKLYVDGNFFFIAITSLFTIPLSKLAMDAIYPIMCSNVASGIDTVFPWWYYPVIYFLTLGLYVIINAFLIKKIKKITPAEAVANRE